MNQGIIILRRHWLPLLGLNVAILAATALSSIYYAKNFSPVWKAKARLNLPVRTVDLTTSLGPLGDLRDSGDVGFARDLNPLELQSTILRSDVVLERVRESDPEKELYPTVTSYRNLFEVTPSEQSTLIQLQTTGSSPELAHQRATRLIEEYQQRLDELRRRDVEKREQYTQDELQKVLVDLQQAQEALSSFKESTGIVDAQVQTNELISAFNNLRATYTTVTAQSQAQKTRVEIAADNLGLTHQQAINSLRLAENRDYQAFRERLAQVETELAQARAAYTGDHPQVQSLLAEQQELRRGLAQQIATVLPGLQITGIDTTLKDSASGDSRIDMIASMVDAQAEAQALQRQGQELQKQLEQIDSELNALSQNQARLLDLQRDYEIAEGVYRAVLAQLEQTKTNPFQVYPNVQTLDEPSVESNPSQPKTWLIKIGGVLASLFGSVALVLGLESRKPLLSPKDLQQVESPVLVNISRLKHPNLEFPNLEAVLTGEIDLEIEFQRLASVVCSLVLDNNRLMVTSSTSGEGKTTVTLGLALALMNFGFRVLVVDGDLRQAQMSRRLGHPPQRRTTSEPVPVSVHPGLDLMPALSLERERIAEFFARGSFERYLNQLQHAGDYDYVLVDSAPVSLAIEPTLMSTVVRNVLFVLRPGISDRYSVMDSFEQLRQQGARIAGLVVNGVESRTAGYRYGYQRELIEAED